MWVAVQIKGDLASLILSNPETIMSTAPGLISGTRSVGCHAIIIFLYAYCMLGIAQGTRHGSTEMWLSRKAQDAGFWRSEIKQLKLSIREANCAAKSRQGHRTDRSQGPLGSS